MKNKNYKNPYSKEDKIYSKENMLDMSLREMMSRKDELLAQTDVLGIPEEEELKNSENAVYVEAYTRDDGTEVKAHWRSKPNGDLSDNFGVSTGYAAKIENKNTQEMSNYKSSQLNLTAKLQENIAKNFNINNPYKEYYKYALRMNDIKQNSINPGNNKYDEYKIHNNYYRLAEMPNSELKQAVISKLIKNRNLDLRRDKILIENADIIQAKGTSPLVKEIEKSYEWNNFIRNNADKIKNGKFKDEVISITFNKTMNLFSTLHVADIYNLKYDEKSNSISADIIDDYDFKETNYNGMNYYLNEVNNNAYKQQKAGHLKNYILCARIKTKL